MRVGDVIPYIICKGAEDDKKQLMGERAFHPETVKKKNLQIDLEWYFTAQIYPPIARLIEPLDGTDNVLIAQCLGLDPTKFGIRLNTTGIDSNVALPSFTDDSIKYKDVEKLVLKCPSCSKVFLGVLGTATKTYCLFRKTNSWEPGTRPPKRTSRWVFTRALCVRTANDSSAALRSPTPSHWPRANTLAGTTAAPSNATNVLAR